MSFVPAEPLTTEEDTRLTQIMAESTCYSEAGSKMYDFLARSDHSRAFFESYMKSPLRPEGCPHGRFWELAMACGLGGSSEINASAIARAMAEVFLRYNFTLSGPGAAQSASQSATQPRNLDKGKGVDRGSQSVSANKPPPPPLLKKPAPRPRGPKTATAPAAPPQLSKSKSLPERPRVSDKDVGLQKQNDPAFPGGQPLYPVDMEFKGESLEEVSRSHCDLPGLRREIEEKKREYLQQFEKHRQRATRARIPAIFARMQSLCQAIVLVTWGIRDFPPTVRSLIDSIINTPYTKAELEYIYNDPYLIQIVPNIMRVLWTVLQGEESIENWVNTFLKTIPPDVFHHKYAQWVPPQWKGFGDLIILDKVISVDPLDLIPLLPSPGEGPWHRAMRNATAAYAQVKLNLDKIGYHMEEVNMGRRAEGSASQRGGA